MGKTSIEWTDHSVNPIRARLKDDAGCTGHYCEKISPGCANCYASAFQPRFGMPEFKGKSGNGLAQVEPFLDEARLWDVLRRRKPTTYFWCDMSDMFGHWVKDEWIDKCFATMAATPHHTHQVLTKRTEWLLEYLRMVEDEKDMQRWANAYGNLRPEPVKRPFNFEALDWPLPNVHLGASVENMAMTSRIDDLVRTPAVCRFLSVEPMLEAMKLGPWLRLSWVNGEVRETIHGSDGPRLLHQVIVGGESGNDAREFWPRWARSLRDQCRVAGVAFFMKQMGANVQIAKPDPPWRMSASVEVVEGRVHLKNKKGGDMGEWPEDLRIRQAPFLPARV